MSGFESGKRALNRGLGALAISAAALGACEKTDIDDNSQVVTASQAITMDEIEQALDPDNLSCRAELIITVATGSPIGGYDDTYFVPLCDEDLNPCIGHIEDGVFTIDRSLVIDSCRPPGEISPPIYSIINWSADTVLVTGGGDRCLESPETTLYISGISSGSIATPVRFGSYSRFMTDIAELDENVVIHIAAGSPRGNFIVPKSHIQSVADSFGDTVSSSEDCPDMPNDLDPSCYHLEPLAYPSTSSEDLSSLTIRDTTSGRDFEFVVVFSPQSGWNHLSLITETDDGVVTIPEAPEALYYMPIVSEGRTTSEFLDLGGDVIEAWTHSIGEHNHMMVQTFPDLLWYRITCETTLPSTGAEEEDTDAGFPDVAPDADAGDTSGDADAGDTFDAETDTPSDADAGGDADADVTTDADADTTDVTPDTTDASPDVTDATPDSDTGTDASDAGNDSSDVHHDTDTGSDTTDATPDSDSGTDASQDTAQDTSPDTAETGNDTGEVGVDVMPDTSNDAGHDASQDTAPDTNQQDVDQDGNPCGPTALCGEPTDAGRGGKGRGGCNTADENGSPATPAGVVLLIAGAVAVTRRREEEAA